MKPGDIVYFKSEYKARFRKALELLATNIATEYGKQGGSYEYYFKPGDRYRIETITGVGTGTILNLEDGKLHFAHSEIWDRLITIDEYRELQLNKLGI